MSIMDTPYNLTRLVNGTDLPALAGATDVLLGGHYFGYFTLIIVGFVCFIYMLGKRYSVLTSVAAAMWMDCMMVLFLRPLNLIDNYTFWIFIIMVPLSIFALWLAGRD